MSEDSNKVAGLDGNDTVVLAAIAAVLIGTLTYATIYDNLLTGALLGVIFMAASGLVAFVSRGGTGSQWGLPILGMAMVGLMIHVSRGHNEAHFAVFAFLACLTVYRRMTPVIVGAAAIAVHHLSFNQFQAWGWGPMCFSEPSFMRVIEHALFVVAETVVLLMLALRWLPPDSPVEPARWRP